MWSNLSQLSKKRLSPLQSLFVYSLLSIAIWLVVVDIAQYFLTEYWYVFDHLDSTYTTLGLIGLIIIIAFIAQDSLKVGYAVFIIGIFLLIMVGHVKYLRFYEDLQKIPKIKSISKDWSIQADLITMEGRNFGPETQPGKVRVGDTFFIVKFWSDKMIVVEQPVPHYFEASPMTICRHDQYCVSSSYDHYIRNPDELS